MRRHRANKKYSRERDYCLIEYISINGNRLFSIHHRTALPGIRYTVLVNGTFDQCKAVLQKGWSQEEKQGITLPIIRYK